MGGRYKDLKLKIDVAIGSELKIISVLCKTAYLSIAFREEVTINRGQFNWQ